MKIKFDLDLAGLLLTLFVILKLCHVINWSWWWVMAPLWLPLALAFFGGRLLFGGFIALIASIASLASR